MQMPSPVLGLLGEQLQLAVTATGVRGRREALNETARLLRSLSELDRRVLAQDLLEAGAGELAGVAADRTGPTAAPGAVADLARALLGLDRETLWWVGGALRDPATVQWLLDRLAEREREQAEAAQPWSDGHQAAPAGAAVLRPSGSGATTRAETASMSGTPADPARATTQEPAETPATTDPSAATSVGWTASSRWTAGSGVAGTSAAGVAVPAGRTSSSGAPGTSIGSPATAAPRDAGASRRGRSTPVADRGSRSPGLAKQLVHGDAEGLARLLAEQPTGWRRRAALRRALAEGWSGTLDAVAVVEVFETDADRFAAAARLVRAGHATAQELAPLLPPTAARRLVRRSSAVAG